jgi:FixJ family two-component response regulator
MTNVPAVVFVINNETSMRAALEDLVGSIGLQVRAFASSPHYNYRATATTR